MRYYKYLYLSEGLENKKEKIVRKLEAGKFQPTIHLILLPKQENNQLEIVNSIYFLQPDYPKEDRFVVGIANNYDAAIELVENISREVYEQTGELNIRDYILMKEQEG